MKMISLDGIPGELTQSFKNSVEPMDVIAGAIVQRTIGPTVHAKLEEFVYSKITMLADYPMVKKFASALVLAVAALAVQKGNKRSRGHVVGILGVEVIDVVGAKVRELLPASLQGLVEFNGQYGVLTQDNAYGILTADTAYGEPTADGMAQLQAITDSMTEADPEAEYA